MRNLVRSEKDGVGIAVRPWSPFREFEEHFNRMFNDVGAVATIGSDSNWVPAVDLRETDNEYVLEADLPGLKREEIEIEVLDDTVSIKGTRSASSESTEGGVHRRERSYGAFRRAFRFPGGVDGEAVKANFDNGVLKVTLPKPAQAKPKRIAVSPN